MDSVIDQPGPWGRVRSLVFLQAGWGAALGHYGVPYSGLHGQAALRDYWSSVKCPLSPKEDSPQETSFEFWEHFSSLAEAFNIDQQSSAGRNGCWGMIWLGRLHRAVLWRGREQRKDSRGGKENKKGRGTEEPWEGQKLFSQSPTWKSGQEEANKSSILSLVLTISVTVLDSFTSSVAHKKGAQGVGVDCLGSNPGFPTTRTE